MSGRIVPIIFLLAVVGFMIPAPVWSADPQMHEGTVVSAGAGKLTIKDKGGKDQSFAVDGTTRITVNGKPGRLEELKESTRVQVMIDDKGKVLTVATIDKEKHDEGNRSE